MLKNKKIKPEHRLTEEEMHQYGNRCPPNYKKQKILGKYTSPNTLVTLI